MSVAAQQPSRSRGVLWLAVVAGLVLTVAGFTLTWVMKGGTERGTGAGQTLAEPISYIKPTPGGKYRLVVFGSPESEAKLTGGKKAKVDAVRAFPTPGLYAAEKQDAPIWPLAGYAPDENVFLTSDGRTLVRMEGDWWRTKDYQTKIRLPAEVEAAQLAAPAVSIFRDGKLLHQYALKELVREPDQITHSPEHILWPGGAVLNEAEGRFILFTQDAYRTIFDLTTGEIQSQEKVGLGNKFSQSLVMVVVGLIIIMALAWVYYALIRKPSPR